MSKLEQVYLRGSHLKFVVLPEILKNAPVFKKVGGWVHGWVRRKGGSFGGVDVDGMHGWISASADRWDWRVGIAD